MKSNIFVALKYVIAFVIASSLGRAQEAYYLQGFDGTLGGWTAVTTEATYGPTGADIIGYDPNGRQSFLLTGNRLTDNPSNPNPSAISSILVPSGVTITHMDGPFVFGTQGGAPSSYYLQGFDGTLGGWTAVTTEATYGPTGADIIGYDPNGRQSFLLTGNRLTDNPSNPNPSAISSILVPSGVTITHMDGPFVFGTQGGAPSSYYLQGFDGTLGGWTAVTTEATYGPTGADIIGYDPNGRQSFLLTGNRLTDNPSNPNPSAISSILVPSGVTITHMDGPFVFTIPEPGTIVMMLMSMGTCIGFTFLRNRKVR